MSALAYSVAASLPGKTHCRQSAAFQLCLFLPCIGTCKGVPNGVHCNAAKPTEMQNVVFSCKCGQYIFTLIPSLAYPIRYLIAYSETGS